MKKFLIAAAVAALAVTGVFAEDVTGGLNALGDAGKAVGEITGTTESLQGTWFDKKYNCNWVLQINSSSDVFCILRDADTNAAIYSFTKGNVQNFKSEASSNGFTISWDSAAKNRTYKFTKPLSSTRDLDIDIYHNVYNERHRTTISYVAADARVD